MSDQLSVTSDSAIWVGKAVVPVLRMWEVSLYSGERKYSSFWMFRIELHVHVAPELVLRLRDLTQTSQHDRKVAYLGPFARGGRSLCRERRAARSNPAR